MDADRFDALTRSLTDAWPRREMLRRLTAATVGLALARFPRGGRTKKRKKKKVRRNKFGCVTVGGYCKNAGQCCSGICQGKQGKKKCKAHDTGGCQAGQHTCVELVECTTTAEVAGECFTTTGNAGYCGGLGAGICMDCKRDADCRAVRGPRAACGLCASCSDELTACVGPDPEI